MKIDSEEEAIFIAERKEWGVRSVSKLNRPIQLSAVGAGFTCPKTQSKLFSGEQPHPYELNDSIIHILTHSPVFYKAYCLFSSVREVDIQSPFTHNGC